MHLQVYDIIDNYTYTVYMYVFLFFFFVLFYFYFFVASLVNLYISSMLETKRVHHVTVFCYKVMEKLNIALTWSYMMILSAVEYNDVA